MSLAFWRRLEIFFPRKARHRPFARCRKGLACCSSRLTCAENDWERNSATACFRGKVAAFAAEAQGDAAESVGRLYRAPGKRSPPPPSPRAGGSRHQVGSLEQSRLRPGPFMQQSRLAALNKIAAEDGDDMRCPPVPGFVPCGRRDLCERGYIHSQLHKYAVVAPFSPQTP